MSTVVKTTRILADLQDYIRVISIVLHQLELPVELGYLLDGEIAKYHLNVFMEHLNKQVDILTKYQEAFNEHPKLR